MYRVDVVGYLHIGLKGLMCPEGIEKGLHGSGAGGLQDDMDAMVALDAADGSRHRAAYFHF